MRQRITIILTLVVIIGVLALLNSIAYFKQDKNQDLEIAPNRSTYHSGPTGVRALHDFLSETGYKVMRWRETTEKLTSSSGKLVSTFVVVGQIQVRFTARETEELQKWIAAGGRFVVIDRKLEFQAEATTGSWSVSRRELDAPTLSTNPADPQQMTDKVVPLKSVQPTVFTSNIDSVLPSRFASRLRITPPPEANGHDNYPDTSQAPTDVAPPAQAPSSPAPVVHIGDKEGALLIDYSYGRGRVVVLSDPYIVSNGGIKLHDNLQLALNILGSREELIAFDEYHQGHGITQSALATYFAGTPVLALGAQIGVLVLLVLWTRARRFARPLPLPQVDRRSSLEFVASMAELQERARAFDLAIENIYTRLRRVLARYAGVDYNSSRADIASRIASRSTIDAHKLETLMRQCEDAINGEEITWRQSLDLVRRLRQLERELGLQTRSRDLRQAAENI
jgi:uncharacterized protein DUF4350